MMSWCWRMAAGWLLLACSVQTGTAQTLFTYGRYAVSGDAFLRAFRKNPDSGNLKKAIEAYLPLYVNYRLKVQDAYDRKMDTLPQLVEESAGFREQLAERHMSKAAAGATMEQEALAHSRKDRLVKRLFFPFRDGDSASERKAQLQAAAAARQLSAGASFEQVWKKYNPAQTYQPESGLMGWITAFSLAYPFEQAIFQAGIGKPTVPVPGSNGYHVFVTERERAAVGTVQVAQILIWHPSGASPAVVEAGRRKADSVYRLVTGGMRFDQAALEFSDDRTSYATGGQLAPFGVGEFDPVFETAAFSLKNTGDISKPFQTAYGWHLLRLIRRIPVPAHPDEKWMEQLREKMERNGWTKQASANFNRQVLNRVPFQPEAIDRQKLWQFTDSALRNAKTTVPGLNNSTKLFRIGTQITNVENWILYNRALGAATTDTYQQRFEEYVEQSAVQYYRDHLETFDPEFRLQVQEFKEANLLFAAMDEKVWSAATADTAGLKSFFQQNRQRYLWGKSANAVLFQFSNAAAADSARRLLSGHLNAWRNVTVGMTSLVQSDNGRYEMDQLPEELHGLKPGTCSPVVQSEGQNVYVFGCLLTMKDGGDLKLLEEARGWVTTDYQKLLEERWVAALKKKYPVQLNEQMWKQIITQVSSGK